MTDVAAGHPFNPDEMRARVTAGIPQNLVAGALEALTKPP